MVFNLGKAGLAKFNKFLKYILSNKYKEASTEMLDSEWAGQVKNRANTLSQIIKSA
jgi:lysozyme